MKAIRHMVRGCGYLEHCGEHPGTPFVIALILMGAVTGSKSGWIGSIGGAAFMGIFMIPLYLWGSYERSVLNDRVDGALGEGVERG